VLPVKELERTDQTRGTVPQVMQSEPVQVGSLAQLRRNALLARIRSGGWRSV